MFRGHRNLALRMATRHGMAGGLCFDSKSELLRILFYATGLGAGDEVIFSCRASQDELGAAVRVGAVPVICDIEMTTGNIAAEAFANALTSKTKMVFVGHLNGIVSSISSIVGIARVHDVIVVEDCSDSAGASIGGVLVGGLGDHSIFCTRSIGWDQSESLKWILLSSNSESFSRVETTLEKNVLGSGQGGQSEEFMDELANIDIENRSRHDLALALRKELGDFGWVFALEKEGCINTYVRFPVYVPSAGEGEIARLVNALHIEGIISREPSYVLSKEASLVGGFRIMPCPVGEEISGKVFEIDFSVGKGAKIDCAAAVRKTSMSVFGVAKSLQGEN